MDEGGEDFDVDGYRQQLLADCRDLVQLLFRWRLVTPALLTSMKNTWESFIFVPLPLRSRFVGLLRACKCDRSRWVQRGP